MNDSPSSNGGLAENAHETIEVGYHKCVNLDRYIKALNGKEVALRSLR